MCMLYNIMLLYIKCVEFKHKLKHFQQKLCKYAIIILTNNQ